MWADKEWEKFGIKQLSWTVDKTAAEQLPSGEVRLTASLTGTGKQGFVVHHTVSYTINSDGRIIADNKVSFSDSTVALARMGVRLSLIKELKQFAYFGRGPMENYADRKQGFDIGIYSSSVQDQLTPYEKPMECGNHEDIRWANLHTYSGSILGVKATDGLLQVSALPYTDEQMEKTEYRIDLPPVTATTLVIIIRRPASALIPAAPGHWTSMSLAQRRRSLDMS
jgi:beta-galactosidase